MYSQIYSPAIHLGVVILLKGNKIAKKINSNKWFRNKLNEKVPLF